MMMLMKKTFSAPAAVGLLTVLLPLGAAAQLSDRPFSYDYAPTRETYNFMKYGNTPVEHYTGNARADIPLFEYRDPDFTIPVSIGYASDGFKPFQQTGPLGSGWFLSAGGMVSREVRGVPDDSFTEDMIYKHNNWTGIYYIEGTLVRRDSGFVYDEADIDGRHGNFVDEYGLYGISHKRNYADPSGLNNALVETESDIYHFNFLGHKGRFVIDGRNRPRVYDCPNAGEYRVNLDGLPVSKTPQAEDSYVEITTGDGYRYTFGFNGGREVFEGAFVYNSVNPEASPVSNAGYVSSWMLSKITAPNGRTAEFFYDPPYPVHSFLTYPAWSAALTYYYRNDIKTDTLSRLRISANSVRTAHLSEVRVDGKTVFRLDYTPKGELEYRTDITSEETAGASPLLKLDSIRMYRPADSANPVRKCSFTYGSTDKRLYLEKVSTSRDGDYSMEYHFPLSYDFRRHPLVDHWCYWNGRYYETPAEIMPQAELDEAKDEVLLNAKRDPDPACASYGLLHRLIYPTGGYTEFEYEPHRYSKRLERRSSNGFLPAFVNVPDGVAGGARLRRISDVSLKGDVRSRTFLYCNSLQDTAASSGNLLAWPRYLYRWENDTTPVIKLYSLQSSNTAPAVFDRTHIEYGRVYEVLPDSSYTEYVYSTYDTHPDDWLHLGERSKDGPVGVFVFPCDEPVKPEEDRYDYFHTSLPVAGLRADSQADFINRIHAVPDAADAERGKLLEQNQYCAGHGLLRSTRYEYAYTDDSYVSFVKTPASQASAVMYPQKFHYFNKVFTGSYLPLTVTEAEPGMERRTGYAYNEAGQQRELRVSGGGLARTERKEYLSDLPAGDPLCGFVKRRNLIGYPLRRTTVLSQEGAERIAEAAEYAYRVGPDSLLLTEKERALDPARPTEADGKPRFTDRILYERYDEKGNLLQYRDGEGTVTSLVWGYDGAYPVARITGAAYEEIDLGGLPASGAADADYIRFFRGVRERLPQALVTSWTYLPQVGPTSRTDPSGRTETYEYDAKGRLTNVRDEDGNILENHVYSLSCED